MANVHLNKPDTPSASHPVEGARTVVFYDGECLFCQGGARWFLRRDRRRRLVFASLQGDTAARLFADTDLTTSLKTLVVATEPGTPRQALHLKTSAVVTALKELPGLWPMVARLLQWVPRSLADAGYDFIARHRHRLRREQACPLPAEEGRRVAEEGRWLP